MNNVNIQDNKKRYKAKYTKVYDIKMSFMGMLIATFMAYMLVTVLGLYDISIDMNLKDYKEIKKLEEALANITGGMPDDMNVNTNINDEKISVNVRVIDNNIESIEDTKDIEKSITSTEIKNEENINQIKQMGSSDFKTVFSVSVSNAYDLFKKGTAEMLGMSNQKLEENFTSENIESNIVIYKSDIKAAIYGDNFNDDRITNLEEIREDAIEVFAKTDNVNAKNKLINAFFNFETNISIARERLDYKKILEDSNEKVDLEKMKILIFHTHSQETYIDGTSSEDGGVLYAGSLLAEELKSKYGFNVIHYTGVHDMVGGSLMRDGSYERIEDNVKQIINENKDIQLAIDLHRDGVGENVRLIADIDDKKCAQVMFVNGISMLNKGGVLEDIISLKNEYLYNNLNLSMNMHLTLDTLYPGLSRRILIKPYRYSLHMLPNSVLIELGAQNNTIEEVKNTIPYLADSIAKSLLIKNDQ